MEVKFLVTNCRVVQVDFQHSMTVKKLNTKYHNRNCCHHRIHLGNLENTNYLSVIEVNS